MLVKTTKFQTINSEFEHLSNPYIFVHAQTHQQMSFPLHYSPKARLSICIAILLLLISEVAICQNIASELDTITKDVGSKVEHKIYYGNKNLREIVRLKNGLQEGAQELYYAEGTKASSREYHEGHLDGLIMEWDIEGHLTEKKTLRYNAIAKKSQLDGVYFQYVNNILRKRIEYKKDKKNGRFEEYYANGVIKTKCTFIDDHLSGLKQDFNNLGQLICKSNYSYLANEKSNESQLDGDYYSYSNEGALTLSGKYHYNKKTGLWREYTNKGILTSEVEYLEGRRHGLASYFYENGKLKSRNTFYELIIIEGKTFRNVYDGAKTEYFASGRIQQSEHYKMGIKDGVFERYYETGTISSRNEFLNGLQTGVENYWDANGMKTAETKFEIIKKDSSTVSQKTDTTKGWKDGILISEVPFQSGKENGIRKSYYPSGKIASAYSLKAGLLQGKAIEYYENGQIKTSRNYYTPINAYSQSPKTVDWSYHFKEDGSLIGKGYNDSTENTIFKKGFYEGVINQIEIGKCLSINFFPEGKVMSIQIKDLYRRNVNAVSYYRNGIIRKIEIQDPETRQFSALNYSDKGEYLGCTLEMNNAPDSSLSSDITAEKMKRVFGNNIIPNNLFTDSILNGRYELKYANGKMMGSLEFENDLPNGNFVFYDPWKGDTLTYKYFENGLPSGYYVEKFAGKTTTHRGKIPSYNEYGWEEQYSPEGIPTSRRVFNKDQSKQIESTEYFPDGKIKSINNNLNGTSAYYNSDGSLLFHTVLLNDSLKHYREYYPGTTIVKTSKFMHNGNLDSLYATYYPSGKPQTYQYYKNNKREGLFQTFNEKGEVTYFGKFVNDLQEGEFIDQRSGKNDTLVFVSGKLQIKSTNIECACIDTAFSTSKLRFAQSISSLIEYPRLMNYISPSFKLKDSLNFTSLFFTNLQTDNNNNAGFASFSLQMFKDFSIMIPADEQLILNFNPCRTNGYLSKMDLLVHYESDFKSTYVTLYPKRIALSFAKGPLKSSNSNYPFFTTFLNVEEVEYRYNKELIIKESKKPDYCFTPARLKNYLDIQFIQAEISLYNDPLPFLDRTYQDKSGIKYSELNNFFGIVSDNADVTFPLKTSKGLNTYYAKSTKTLAGGKYVSGNIIIPCKKQSDDVYEINRGYGAETFSFIELKANWIKNGFTRVKSFFDYKTNELTIYYFAE